MHELEARLRDYEQVGIEASAEIQSAARRVLDENRKLRALLHERGVSESEVVAAMGDLNDRSYDQVSASASLSAMLERRITCDTPAFLNSPTTPHPLDVRNSPDTPTNSSLMNTMPRSAALSSNDSPSPHSIVSGIGTPPPSFHGTPYLHALTPDPETNPEDVAQYMPYDQSLQAPWPQVHSQHHQYAHRQQYVPDPTNFYSSSSSSCVDAANIIRTMRTNTGPELEAEFGCRPGQQCYVSNAVVFDVLDRYASPHGV